MQDEHFIRDWNAGHVRFSADVDGALRSEAHRLRMFVALCSETALARRARLTGTAVIAGILGGAGLATFLLLLTAAAATPETSHQEMACVATRSLA